MKLVIYSDDEAARRPLAVSAKSHGFEVHVATGTYRWYKDLETRTRQTLKVLESFDPNEIVVVTDGHDMFVNNSSETFLWMYKQYYDGKVVYQSEHQNWPDPRLEEPCLKKFTDPDGYSFLCFGMHAGPAGRLVELYKEGLEIGFTPEEQRRINPHCSWEFDDQLFAIKQYIKNDDIVIDHRCVLCQSMQAPALKDLEINNGVVVNTLKKTEAVFVHGHGNVHMKEIYNRVVNLCVFGH